jgi:biopolymer transport protein TolR
LSVDKEGDVYLEDEAVPWANLEAKLKAAARREPGRRVVLRGDKDANYTDVRRLYRAAQQVGFPGVSLKVNHRLDEDGKRPAAAAAGALGEDGEPAVAMDVAAAPTKKGRAHPEMNVTPLVDVVLVLLITFMVLTAMMNDHFWVHVPQKETEQKQQQETPESDPDQEAPIVVTVNREGRIQINQDVFADREFPERLRRMLVARGERRIYFDATDGVPYARAVEVLDLARGGGAAHIAVVTEKLQ